MTAQNYQNGFRDTGYLAGIDAVLDEHDKDLKDFSKRNSRIMGITKAVHKHLSLRPIHTKRHHSHPEYSKASTLKEQERTAAGD